MQAYVSPDGTAASAKAYECSPREIKEERGLLVFLHGLHGLGGVLWTFGACKYSRTAGALSTPDHGDPRGR